jgi:WD40 repeat protein
MTTILRGHTNTVDSVAFSPDGKTLVSSSYEKEIRLWDLKTAKEVNTFGNQGVRLHSVKFSPDGKTLALAAEDSVQLWDVATEKRVAALQHPDATVVGVAFSPDGKTLASVGSDRTIRVWDMLGAKSVDK